MTTFSEKFKEHNAWIQEAREELAKAIAVKDAFIDHHINELDSDLDNALEDLEREKDLTAELKKQLKGVS